MGFFLSRLVNFSKGPFTKDLLEVVFAVNLCEESCRAFHPKIHDLKRWPCLSDILSYHILQRKGDEKLKVRILKVTIFIYIYIIDSLNFNGLDIPIWLSFWFVLNITSYLQIAMGSPVPAGQILLERDTQLGCTEMPWWNLGWATLTKTLGFSSRIVECTPWKFQKFHLWTYNADTLPRSQTLNVRMSEKKIPSHLSGQSTLRSAGDCGDGVPNCVSAQFCGFLVPLLDTSNPIRIRFLNQYFD